MNSTTEPVAGTAAFRLYETERLPRLAELWSPSNPKISGIEIVPPLQ